jgi:hypothetical protein
MSIMNASEVRRQPAHEVSLRPVFRYSERRAPARAWVWWTGAALLVALVAALLPQLL